MSANNAWQDDAAHSYFTPMVDMLAGVVFVLVILLAAVSLVSREDFVQAQEMEEEIARIQAELDAARRIERDVLIPRRAAAEALRLLLANLERALEADGVRAEAHPDEGVLLIDADGVFAGGGALPGARGAAVTAAIGEALSAELPCVAGATPRPATCAAYPAATVELATLAASGDATGATAELRALTLLAALGQGQPGLLALTAPDGDNVLVYRAGEPAAVSLWLEEAPAASIEMTFRMQLPPLPQ